MDTLELHILSMEKHVLLNMKKIQFSSSSSRDEGGEVFIEMERIMDRTRLFLDFSNPHHSRLYRALQEKNVMEKLNFLKLRQTSSAHPVRMILYFFPEKENIWLFAQFLESILKCHFLYIELEYADKFQETSVVDMHLLDLYELGYWQDHSADLAPLLFSSGRKMKNTFMGMDILATRRMEYESIPPQHPEETEEDFLELCFSSRDNFYLNISFSESTYFFHQHRINPIIKTLLNILPFHKNRKQVMESIWENNAVLELNTSDIAVETKWDIPWFISNLARILAFFETYTVYSSFRAIMTLEWNESRPLPLFV